MFWPERQQNTVYNLQRTAISLPAWIQEEIKQQMSNEHQQRRNMHSWGETNIAKNGLHFYFSCGKHKEIHGHIQESSTEDYHVVNDWTWQFYNPVHGTYPKQLYLWWPWSNIACRHHIQFISQDDIESKADWYIDKTNSSQHGIDNHQYQVMGVNLLDRWAIIWYSIYKKHNRKQTKVFLICTICSQ